MAKFIKLLYFIFINQYAKHIIIKVPTCRLGLNRYHDVISLLVNFAEINCNQG